MHKNRPEEFRSSDVRFYAAEALAYLNDADCTDVFGDAAVNQPNNRPYALAALAAMDQAASHLRLRKLHGCAGRRDPLRCVQRPPRPAADDPFLGQVRVLDDPARARRGGRATRWPWPSPRPRRQGRREDPFALYLVDCEGPPMIHVAEPDGARSSFSAGGEAAAHPVVLGTRSVPAERLRQRSEVQISKMSRSRSATTTRRSQASLELGDVVRRPRTSGPGYPES